MEAPWPSDRLVADNVLGREQRLEDRRGWLPAPRCPWPPAHPRPTAPSLLPPAPAYPRLELWSWRAEEEEGKGEGKGQMLSTHQVPGQAACVRCLADLHIHFLKHLQFPHMQSERWVGVDSGGRADEVRE